MPENRRPILEYRDASDPSPGPPHPKNRNRRDGGGVRDAQPSAPGRPAEKSSRYGSSFEARFGRVILQHGIAAIPSAIFHYQGEVGLKAQHVWFISYILSHKWDEDLPYPSLSNMARSSGVTLRNIQFIKSDLCRAGMLEVKERYNRAGGRDSNAYDFSGLFTHLEDLISEDNDEPNRIVAEPAAPETYADAGPGGPDPSFVARFGRVIARRGVAAVPRAIFTHQKALTLTPQQIWFVSYIFSFQWSTTLPYPSINRMVLHTGYSRAHLHTIKAELVEAGYLRLVHRTNEQGGQDSNAYDFSGLLDAIREQLQPDEPLTEAPAPEPEQQSPRGRHLFAPRRGQSAARRRVSKHDGPDPHEEEQTGAYESQHTIPYEGEPTGIYESEQTPRYEAGRTRSVQRGSYGPTNVRGRGSMKRAGHESEPLQIETNEKKDDSNHRSPKKKESTNGSKLPAQSYSPYIAAIAADFSRELGDSAHEASNMRQALNLWQASGLQDQEFVELMHEARKLTRRYQSRPTWDAMRNKMAYYFQALRDLVGRVGESES
ncbi:MAG: hypothetical protein ACJ78Q_05135 [Chloroflexia bacterium]